MVGLIVPKLGTRVRTLQFQTEEKEMKNAKTFVVFFLLTLALVGCGAKRQKISNVPPAPQAQPVQANNPYQADQYGQPIKRQTQPQTQEQKDLARFDEVVSRRSQTSLTYYPTPEEERAHEAARLEQVRETTQTLKTGTQTVIRSSVEIVLPRYPRTKTRLTEEQIRRSLDTIQKELGPEKFGTLKAELEKIQEGPNAWTQAEDLIFKHIDGRATDTPATTDINQVTIAKTVGELEKNFKEVPKTFAPVLWNANPIGACKVKKRNDLLGNAAAIEKKIDEIYADDPRAAQAWKKAFHACANQVGDSPTCFDAYVKDYPIIERNYGASTFGENEFYDPKTTNVLDARMTIYFIPELGTFKGNGWECCGNPLEFFTYIRWKGETETTLTHNPQQLSCSIAPEHITFASRADHASFNLTVNATPMPNLEDVTIDWLIGVQSNPLAKNTNMVDVMGTRPEIQDRQITPIQARVVVGTKEVVCNADVTLRFPPQTVVVPPPACTALVNHGKSILGPEDFTVFEAQLENVPSDTKFIWYLNGKVVPGYVPKFSFSAKDYPNLMGTRVKIRFELVDMKGIVLAHCENEIVLQRPPKEETHGFCGWHGIKCWGPPLAAGIGFGIYEATKKHPQQTPGYKDPTNVHGQ